MSSDKEKRLIELQDQIEHNQELSQKLFNEEQDLIKESTDIFLELLKESGVFSKYDWEVSIDNYVISRGESIDLNQLSSSESRAEFRKLFSIYNYHHNVVLDAGVALYFSDDSIFLRIENINNLPEIAKTFGLKIRPIISSKVMERHQFVVNLLDKIK